MPGFLNPIATPLVTGFLLASALTGLALMVHVGPRGLHPAHEWLSLGLILPVLLHLWRNWRPFRAWWRQPVMPLALGLSGLAVVPFLWPAQTGRAGGPPRFALARLILDQSPERIAPLPGHSPQTLAARLADQGIPIADPASPLRSAAPQTDEATLAAALVATANPGAEADRAPSAPSSLLPKYPRGARGARGPPNLRHTARPRAALRLRLYPAPAPR